MASCKNSEQQLTPIPWRQAKKYIKQNPFGLSFSEGIQLFAHIVELWVSVFCLDAWELVVLLSELQLMFSNKVNATQLWMEAIVVQPPPKDCFHFKRHILQPKWTPVDVPNKDVAFIWCCQVKYDGKFGLHLECKTTVAFTYVLFAGIDEMISVNNLNLKRWWNCCRI